MSLRPTLDPFGCWALTEGGAQSLYSVHQPARSQHLHCGHSPGASKEEEARSQEGGIEVEVAWGKFSGRCP